MPHRNRDTATARPAPRSERRRRRPRPTPPNNARSAKALGEHVTLGDAQHGTVAVTIDRALTDPEEVRTVLDAPSGPPVGQFRLVLEARLEFRAGAEPGTPTDIDATLTRSLHRQDGSVVNASECIASVANDLTSVAAATDGVEASGHLCFLVPTSAASEPLLLRLGDPWCSERCDGLWIEISEAPPTG